jgi:hypothetical protein
MFEHFTSVACEFSQPLLFTPQKSTSMEVMLIFSHCVPTIYSVLMFYQYCVAISSRFNPINSITQCHVNWSLWPKLFTFAVRDRESGSEETAYPFPFHFLRSCRRLTLALHLFVYKPIISLRLCNRYIKICTRLLGINIELP